ncbi:MAG: 30S ribosomal protein S7 [Elusimicrobiota bacterium]
MPRDHRKVEKRELKPDYVYNNIVVSKVISKLGFRGKKTLYEKIFYRAMQYIKDKTKQDPINVFNTAIEKARPMLEVKPRRVGGATYQVPIEATPARGETLAVRWILQYARARTGKPIHQRLAEEIMETARGEGSVIKKREDTHKMAEANRAFAHYRW